MPIDQFILMLDETQRDENRRLADLIVAVNQGTNGQPDDVKLLLSQLRNG